MRRTVLAAAAAMAFASVTVADTALYFNGSTYIDLKKNFALGNSVSLSAWVRVDPSITANPPYSVNGKETYYGAGIVGQGYWGGTTGFGIFIAGNVNTPDTSDDKISTQVRYGDEVNVGPYYTNSTLFTAGEWHHYLLVRDKTAGKVYFYADGVLASSTDFPSATSIYATSGKKTTNFAFGKNMANVGGIFKGYIADVGLWNVALTAEDAALLATTTPDRIGTTPYAYWPLDDGNGSQSVTDVISGTPFPKTAGSLIWEDDPALHRLSGNTLVVSANLAEYGEPSPPYGYNLNLATNAAIAVSCTPAVTNAAETTMATCTGWKLYDIDGNEVSNGVGSAFAYLHPGAYRRLEWQFLISHKVVATAADGGSASPPVQWVAEGAAATVAAAPDDPATTSFLKWTGDIPGGKGYGSPFTFTVTGPASVQAQFYNGSGTARIWTGAVDNFWENSTNWIPQGVPTANDAVMITSNVCWIKSEASAARIEVYQGASLFFASTGTVTAARAAWADAPRDRRLSVAGDLLCAGNLALGGRWILTEGVVITNLDVSVGGDFKLLGSAKCGVYANTMTNAITWRNLYDAAARVAVAGDMIVTNTAIIYPTADRLTGTPVRFSCRNFLLDSGAKVNAENRGWGWITYTNASQIDPRRKQYGTYSGVSRFTLAPNSPGISEWSGSASYACPYKYAPFAPGTQSGAYNTPSDGGGQFWLRATGAAIVNGTINVNGEHSAYSGNSGGGIWIAARRFTAGESALLTSTGGKNTHYRLDALGGSGGAISIALGVSEEDLFALATNAAPDSLGLDHIDDILVANYTVRGGYAGTDANGVAVYGRTGTATTVYGSESDVSIIVQSASREIGSPNPSYGAHMFEPDSDQTFACEGYGYDSVDPQNVRFVCVGYAVSNSTAEVAHGDSNTFTLNVGTRALTVHWIWGGREIRFPVSVPTNAAVVVNGTSYSESGSVWVGEATPIVFEAVPDSGCEFLCWEGEVPEGLAKANPITLPAETPRRIRPVVRAVQSATSRKWNGGTAEWTNPAKWTPAGLPGFGDTISISSGTCLASNYFECANLSLSGAAKLKVGATATKLLEEAALVVKGNLTMTNTATLDVSATSNYRRGRIEIGGDLLLAGTNTLTVCAGPITETRTFATGAGFVNVGGDFSVLGGSKVTPVSSPYTGGSVVFRVSGDFTLGPRAKFTCPEKGWARVSEFIPNCICPGCGYDYTIGGGYGGTGWGANGTYGNTYGFVNAPIHPGSPKGAYNFQRAGGGLVRVHAKRVQLAGTVNAKASDESSWASAPSGGGVWITSSGKFILVDGASFTVKGGFGTNYTSEGGGGRIAFGAGLSDRDVAELAETGELQRLRPRNILDRTAFTNQYPNVSIDISCGRNTIVPPHAGTFRFLDARIKNTVLLLK